MSALHSWWENLNENYKRIILILCFSITVAILIFAVYTIFFKPKPKPKEALLPTEISFGILPMIGQKEQLEKEETAEKEQKFLPTLIPAELKPDQVALGGTTLAQPQIYTGARDVNLGQNGSLHYYDSDDGKFYTLNQDGSLKTLSDKSFLNVQKTTWSNQGNKAILEFPDGSNIFYDFLDDKQYTLPKEGQDFDFSKSGNKIAYEFITENPDENWLIVSDPTGENTTAVEHIGEANYDDVLVNWSSDGARVALYRNSAGIDNEEVFFIGQNHENFKSLNSAGRGFEGLWSPDANRLLYNIYNAQSGYRPELWITDARDVNMGVHNKNLELRTWVNKCVFSSDNITVYCSVPMYLEQGAGIYPQLGEVVPDVIYKINVKTSFKQQIAIPTDGFSIGLYSAEKLILSPDEKILYMADKNGGIYKIQLK